MKRIIAASIIATMAATTAFAGPVIKSQAPVQPTMSTQSSIPNPISPEVAALVFGIIALIAATNHTKSTPSTT